MTKFNDKYIYIYIKKQKQKKKAYKVLALHCNPINVFGSTLSKLNLLEAQ